MLKNPANRNRAVPLTSEQFRYAFANAVGEDEAKELYETYPCPDRHADLPGRDRKSEPVDRGEGRHQEPRPRATADHLREKDHTVPPAIAKASYKKQEKNEGVTEYMEMPGRGHSLMIDNGWRDVADTALAFVQRFV